MAAMTTYDEFLARLANGYYRQVPIQSTLVTNNNCITSGPNDSALTKICKWGARYTIPSMESGVSAYIPLRTMYSGNGETSLLIGRMTNLGDLTLGDGAGGASSFADGSQMPTVTELGVASVQRASMVVAEVTTVFSALPGNMTITYVDQDGNTAEAGPSNTLRSTAAVGECGWVQLNTDDWGVRDITTSSRTGGTNPSGVMRFWGIEPIAFFSAGPAGSNNPAEMEDFLIQSLNLFRLSAGDLIGGFFMASAATISTGEGYGQFLFAGDQT